MRTATVEELVQEFDEVSKQKGYDLLTQEQTVECAFAAAYTVGYRNGFEDAKEQVIQKFGEQIANG